MKSIEVVAAVIRRGNQVFATQRGYGDFKDWWEFPGGKIEPGESRSEALVREIREELDAVIKVGEAIGTVRCSYPSFHLTMHCFWCSLSEGELLLKEHEAARWLSASDIRSVKWLPADMEILPKIISGLNGTGVSVCDGMVHYDMGEGVKAFSPFRDTPLPFRVLQAHQVHSDRIAVIRDPGTCRDDLEGIDAMITAIPGLALGVRTADCVPVLLYDPVNRVIACIHSGWRGTVMRITEKTIRKMEEEFGTRAEDLHAVIGPSIGPQSFQVGPEVSEAFEKAGFPMDSILKDCGPVVSGTMNGGLHIDLWQAVAGSLSTSGVQHRNITISGYDSYTDTAFFSARREGASCGRTVSVILLEHA